ncbi:hypothetical protein IAU60_000144 [Kwoniella sp. DSM 27419]
MSKVHQVAVSGFGEGTNDIYDRARPSYPADALQHIHEVIASSPAAAGAGSGAGWQILEPGSGTGIFSRLLLFPPEGYPRFGLNALVGVEPSEGMRNAWQRGYDKASGLAASGSTPPTATSVEGSFDDFSKVASCGIHQVTSGGGSGAGGVNAIIIAQAWHWCPDHESALREIASYLPPGSPLILIWNLEGSTPAYQAAIRAAYEPYNLGTPQYYKGLWRAMFDTKAYKEMFEEKEEWSTEWTKETTADQLVERLFSKSYLTPAHLSPEDHDTLEAKLRGIIADGEKDGLQYVDREKGTFNYRYTTDVVVLRRKAA